MKLHISAPIIVQGLLPPAFPLERTPANAHDGDMRRKQAQELATRTASGELMDAALHEAILANPSAEEKISRMAVERAIGEGITPEVAEQLYGRSPGKPG